MKNILLLLILTSYINSCIQENSKLKEVNIPKHFMIVDPQKAKSIHVKDLFTSIRIKSLKCPDSSCFQDVGKVMATADSGVIILDRVSMTVSIFDKEGLLVGKIKALGTGPQQYTAINDIELDRTRENILILDLSRQSMLKFDLQGNFVSRKLLSGINQLGVKFHAWENLFLFERCNSSFFTPVTALSFVDSSLQQQLSSHLIVPSKHRNVYLDRSHPLELTEEEAWYIPFGQSCIQVLNQQGIKSTIMLEVPDGKSIEEDTFFQAVNSSRDLLSFLRTVHNTDIVWNFDRLFLFDAYGYMSFQQKGKLYHLFWEYPSSNPRIYRSIKAGEKSFFPLPQARLGNSWVSVVRGGQIPSLMEDEKPSEFYFLICQLSKHE